MFQGFSGFASLLKEASNLGGRVRQVQETLRQRRAVGSAGGGMVEIEINGVLEVLRCKIDPGLVAQSDRELIEDLVAAAVNQAITKGRQFHAEALREMTGGLSLPGLNEAIASFAGAGPPAADAVSGNAAGATGTTAASGAAPRGGIDPDESSSPKE